MTVFPYYMKDLDEVLGDLHHIEEHEGRLLALIGKIPVILPLELAEKLQNLVGRRIGILRLDGYHIREVA